MSENEERRGLLAQDHYGSLHNDGYGGGDGGEGMRRRASRRRSTRAARSSSSGCCRGGFVWDRVFCLLLLSVAVVVSVVVVFQRQVTELKHVLEAQQETLVEQQRTIDWHGTVIDRFNSSITNADVRDRLAALEKDLAEKEASVRAELERVEKDIKEQLDETVQELSDTVQAAEEEISNKVEQVKKDVAEYAQVTQDQFSMENSFMVYQLAGTITLLSCLISMWHMTAHLRRMNQPDVQRKILAILWMSPIYAVTSWFSLVFPKAEGYLAIIKDGYEAYIIYQFLSFCISVLGKGDRSAVVDLLAQHADHLTPPYRLSGPFELCGLCVPEPYESDRALADAVLLQCQSFAMQFVFLRPLTTTAQVVLAQLDYYGAGTGAADPRSPQFYITIVQNVSIFVAFTGLLKFYHAVDQDLAWCRPFAKFLCIKGVVFMTFWQGLALSILAETTSVGGANSAESWEWAKRAQNFLICMEMLVFSVAHFYCFPTEEWQDGYRVKQEKGQFGDSIALGDFLSDIKLILRSGSKHRKKKKAITQPVIPEGNEEETEADEGGLDEEAGRTGSGAFAVAKAQDRLVVPTDQDGPLPVASTSVRSSAVSALTVTDECSPLTAASANAAGSGGDPFDGYDDVDTDDDETTSLVSYSTDFTTSSGMNDEERAAQVSRALEEALGCAADDPDIIEAKERLLASKVLQPEFFDETGQATAPSANCSLEDCYYDGLLPPATPRPRGYHYDDYDGDIRSRDGEDDDDVCSCDDDCSSVLSRERMSTLSRQSSCSERSGASRRRVRRHGSGLSCSESFESKENDRAESKQQQQQQQQQQQPKCVSSQEEGKALNQLSKNSNNNCNRSDDDDARPESSLSTSSSSSSSGDGSWAHDGSAEKQNHDEGLNLIMEQTKSGSPIRALSTNGDGKPNSISSPPRRTSPAATGLNGERESPGFTHNRVSVDDSGEIQDQVYNFDDQCEADDEGPVEATGLLSGQDGSTLTEKLRPSIFTMASAANTTTSPRGAETMKASSSPRLLWTIKDEEEKKSIGENGNASAHS